MKWIHAIVSLLAIALSIVEAGDVTTFAGTGQKGFSGDGGPAAKAQLNNPFAIARGEKAKAQDILAFQQPCNGAFANGQGAKNERPVRNRLVAGYPDPSLDRAALAGCQRHWFGRVHRGGILGNLRPPTTQPRAASSCRFWLSGGCQRY